VHDAQLCRVFCVPVLPDRDCVCLLDTQKNPQSMTTDYIGFLNGLQAS